MKILIDMNLSPSWVEFFQSSGIDSVHWSAIGEPNAEDIEIMQFAKINNYIIFTHDLDFGAILALSNFDSPSVIQIRSQNIMPSNIGNRIVKALIQFEDILNDGALIIIDDFKERARILPLKKS
jgi:predicted nuclease of predicted toxin-antitoxin system